MYNDVYRITWDTFWYLESFWQFLLGNFIFGKFGRNFFVTHYLTSVRFLQMMAGNGTVLKALAALGFTNCQSVIHHFSIRYPSFFDVFVLAPFVTWLPRPQMAPQLPQLRGGPSMSAGSASGSWDCSSGN